MAQTTKPKSATSYKDTAFGIISRSKVVELEKEGVKRALEHVIKLSEDKPQITSQLIRSIHREGFGFIFPDWAGKFRTIDVTVGEYVPPHYSRIAELIQTLCDDLEERVRHLPSFANEEVFLAELISLLAWFQNRFVWIHPFQDYNGRVGRLLTNLLLLNVDFPILEIKADTDENREAYIQAMKAADKQNYLPLEELITSAIRESLEIS